MSFIFVTTFSLILTAALPFAQDPQKDAKTEKIRVFVTDSNTWELSGGFGTSDGSGGGALSGGSRPQTVEIMKTFGERCPEVTITRDKQKATFVVLLDHEGGKGYARRDNKVAVFSRDQDMIYSGSTRSLGNGVKDACEAIKKSSGISPSLPAPK